MLVNILWLHERIGNAAPLFMIGVGIISLVNYVRGQGVDGNIVGAVIIGELMMIVQVSLGLFLYFAYALPANVIHFLYGALTILAFPALWVYTQGAMDRRASLIWALAGLFMMGLTLRAIGTAT